MEEIAASNQMTEAEAQALADQITEAANKRAQTAHEEDDHSSSSEQVTSQ